MDVNDNQEPDGNYRREQTMSSGNELCKKSCEMFDFSNTPKAKLSNATLCWNASKVHRMNKKVWNLLKISAKIINF